MYTLSLEIVNKCNLNCSYCYLGEKKNVEMDFLVAKKAIDLGVVEAIKQNDKTILVYFIGGEPLIAIELIKELVIYIKNECEKYIVKPIFSVTSNGTLLNPDIIAFLYNNKFTVKISLDGDKYIHDINRRYYDGSGSYDKIINNLYELLEYQSDPNFIVQVANVVTINNYKFLEESLEHLSNIGFVYIETGIDNFSNWDNDNKSNLKNEIYRAFQYYKEMVMKRKRIYWSLFEKELKTHLTSTCFYFCKAGLKSIYVNVDGDIYPCTQIDETVCIGNVFSGLDVKKIRSFVCITESQNKDCLKCSIYRYCKASGCIMGNYQINGDFFQPSKIQCFLSKMFHELICNEFTIEQLNKMKGDMREWLMKKS